MPKEQAMLVKCHCGSVCNTYYNLAWHVYCKHHEFWSSTYNYIHNCPWCDELVLMPRGTPVWLPSKMQAAYESHCAVCSKYKLFQLFGTLQERSKRC